MSKRNAPDLEALRPQKRTKQVTTQKDLLAGLHGQVRHHLQRRAQAQAKISDLRVQLVAAGMSEAEIDAALQPPGIQQRTQDQPAHAAQPAAKQQDQVAAEQPLPLLTGKSWADMAEDKGSSDQRKDIGQSERSSTSPAAHGQTQSSGLPEAERCCRYHFLQGECFYEEECTHSHEWKDSFLSSRHFKEWVDAGKKLPDETQRLVDDAKQRKEEALAKAKLLRDSKAAPEQRLVIRNRNAEAGTEQEDTLMSESS
ncbi:hypothetical protein KC357_g6877 [Hortaea werneckii]|nr:hypothetical protein KC357_g6877 [Hortaea werneckii]